MRAILFIFLSVPICSLAQKTDVFVKLMDSRGQQIKGDALLKGYERWIGATTLTSAGKNNTQLSFTMTVSGASADLKRAIANSEILPTGQVTVLAPGQSTGIPLLSYTIKMENVAVLACNETLGCDNAMITTVSLLATRIGWTYYQVGKTGTQTISKKFGWDADSQSEWTNF
jgi:type VI protein secretion system component Hcp